jgi:hypothetical protein
MTVEKYVGNSYRNFSPVFMEEVCNGPRLFLFMRFEVITVITSSLPSAICPRLLSVFYRLYAEPG